MRITLSINKLIVGAALFLTAFANLTFFRNVLNTFAAEPWGYAHSASLGLVLFCALIVLLSLLALTRALKPLLALVFLVSSATAYFMDTYNVIIDRDMIANVVATNPAESLDLVTPQLIGYLLLLGVLPGALIWLIRIERETFTVGLRRRAMLIAGALLTIVALAFLSSGFYASFIREHKPLRYYTNPTAPIQGVVSYTRRQFASPQGPLRVIGEDARIPQADIDRELIILVVGETARADRFSLNGYQRETNPVLAQKDVINFSNVSACGTSTAISVPCMFSTYGRDKYSDGKARNTENLLDVINRANISVIWRDNNSDSKGVATRVPFENYRSRKRNTICDPECRDTGMLVGLQDYIDSRPEGDILIVLHQMGSHGPAYHKRYPEAFRKFEPTCETSQLDGCTPEAIGNTYDNTILYTDYFLGKVIEFLSANDDRFETAMLYASDHGESLGEAGLYLHGLPYFVAPDTQTKVPMIMWLGKHYDGISTAALNQVRDQPYSHDNIFHTVLGLFEVQSTIYDPEKDILQQARNATGQQPEYGYDGGQPSS